MPVALMTPAAAVTAVRSATAHDVDQQVTDAQITAELDREYRRVRRWLTTFLPSLYQKSYLATIAPGANTITKPDDFERLIRLERQFSQGYWQPLGVRPALSASEGIIGDVAGSYRLFYTARPVDGYTSYDLPEGCQDILINLVAAWVRVRFEEDPSYHMGRAEQLKQEIRRDTIMRQGSHPVTMLNHGPPGYWYGSFYEEGDHFVIV